MFGLLLILIDSGHIERVIPEQLEEVFLLSRVPFKKSRGWNHAAPLRYASPKQWLFNDRLYPCVDHGLVLRWESPSKKFRLDPIRGDSQHRCLVRWTDFSRFDFAAKARLHLLDNLLNF